MVWQKEKSFYTVKWTVNKMKKQPTDWGKILANHIHDRIDIKIYKELTWPNNKKTKQKQSDWKNGQTFRLDIFFFSYKTYRSPTGTRKELNITKHQGYANENHDELPPHSFAWLQWEGRATSSLGENVEKIRTFVGCLQEHKLAQSLWEILCLFLKNGKNYHPIQQFHFWVFIWRKQNTNWEQYKHPHVHCSTVYGRQDREQPKCPSMDEWRKHVMHYAMEYNSAGKYKLLSHLWQYRWTWKTLC